MNVKCVLPKPTSAQHISVKEFFRSGSEDSRYLTVYLITCAVVGWCLCKTDSCNCPMLNWRLLDSQSSVLYLMMNADPFHWWDVLFFFYSKDISRHLLAPVLAALVTLAWCLCVCSCVDLLLRKHQLPILHFSNWGFTWTFAIIGKQDFGFHEISIWECKCILYCKSTLCIYVKTACKMSFLSSA